MDSLDIEILEDGTIKTTAGKVGAQNHQSAEAFFKMIASMVGGNSKRVRRGDAPTHHHHHGEAHHEH